MAKRKTGRQCDSCRRLGGDELLIENVIIVVCPECAKSAFRIERCVERAKAAES